MQVSRKQGSFSRFFSPFLKSRSKFEHFQKKDDSYCWGICKITESKKRGYIKV